jgi:hydroxypyruvate isomerase
MSKPRRPDGPTVTRREVLISLAAAATALRPSGRPTIDFSPVSPSGPPAYRLKQSVSRWPYRKIALPELCRAGKKMGLSAIDLLAPEDWPVVRDCGLVCSMGYAAIRDDFIPRGFNNPANHDFLVGELERALPLAQQHGVPNLIAMFGNRQGRSDEAGIDACVTGLRRIAPTAEQHGVTICVELLNSKVDHPDYQGDHTAFGVRVMEGVNSARVKLLYDIYHMQIMEGDVIATIRKNIDHIGHFHTGGVPGRHELDDTQELNWHAIARAIADTGFGGYMAHEFVPTRDPLQSLAQAVKTCAV